MQLDYDKQTLERYQPLLYLEPADREKFVGLYGWVARSPEYDTGVAVYWAEYSHQDGLLGNLDSHYGDHEPVAVEFDPATDEAVRVRASVYHWLKGETTPETVPMDNQNPRLRVINPWHQYTAADPSTPVEQFAVDPLGDVFQSWLDNGLEDALLVSSTTEPWIMRSESDWWASGAAGISVNATFLKAARAAGLGEAGSLST